MREPCTALPGAGEEISALIETLLKTEQRLEDLTAGEIDTVAGRDGRTFMLHRAQADSRRREAAEHAASAATMARQLAELRALVDLMPAMIWFKDTRNVILRVNQRAAETAGKSVAEIEGRPASETYPRDADRFHAEDLRVLQSGVPELGRVETLPGPDGAPLWVRTDTVPYFGADGAAIGVVVMAQDITERRRAEETLRESEERFSGAFEHAAIGMALVALDGRWMRVNRALCTMFGYSEAQLLTRSFQDLTHPEDLRDSVASLRQALAVSSGSFEIEKRYLHASGRVISALLSISLIRDADGAPKYFITQVQDVTARRRADASVARLAEIVESSDDAIISEAPDGVITSWNRGAERLFGYSAGTIIGRSVNVLVPNALLGEEEGILAAWTQGGHVQHLETVRTRADGKSLDVSITISPIKDRGGKVVGASKIVRDITERKRSETSLRASEARFKALFDQAAVGVAVIDVRTGLFLQANRRYCEIVGRTLEQLQACTPLSITHPDDVVRDRELARKLSAGETRDFSVSKRYNRPDGSTVWADLTVSAMWERGAPPDCVVTVAQDVTDRKKLEERLRQSQKMEAIGTLAGGIAHDFNNILAAMSGYVELATMSLKGNPEVRRHLGAVLQASSRATDLVRQILAFSRQQTLERAPIQLGPVVAESIHLLRAAIPTSVVFETSLAADAPTVLADASQVHQVLMNLGTNASHAMKDMPGRLSIRLERCEVDAAQAAAQPQLRPGLYACISFTDTGAGMEPATLARVFEPFFTTKGPGEGTGLGLAVVHGIMESHEGAVTVYSHPGEGTVFRLYFPARAEDPVVPQGDVDPVIRGRGERLLWIDDEELLANLGRETLTALGYEVEATTSPEAALALVRADPSRFSLVMTDQTMPGMTGLLLASLIRAVRADLPIILMTGHSLSITAQRTEAAGICQVLVKPINVTTLASAVHRALSRARAG
jgi:PAS domain S-box-containing protein